ncbi:hypothetical protein [Patulibacter defluvii]|uniref:hypothetical protein n=1 Tax=Patulibacter defluvii TaxID=3095358 RepID=UPI002A74BA15|nr:hypothetical protein [Patulibacter sp. DM4]
MSRPSWSGAAVAVALLALLGPAAAPADATAASAKRATVELRISGLPKGERPRGRLTGPGVRRAVRSNRLTLRRVRAGRYRLTLSPVTLRKARRGMRRGARALPATRTVAVRVKAGKRARIAGRYGTVVSANVVAAPARVQRIVGDPRNPSELVLPRSSRYRVGGYLTSGPTAALPAGLISRITTVRRSARSVRVGVTRVLVTEVIPQHSGGVRLSPTQPDVAKSRAALGGHARRIEGIDLSTSGNAVARDTAAVMDQLPCRFDTALNGSPLSIPVLKPFFDGPTIASWDWSAFSGAVQVRGSLGRLGMEWHVPEGLTGSCSESEGFARTFVVLVAGVPLPMFVGMRAEAGLGVSSADGPSTGQIGGRIDYDFDSSRASDKLRLTASPLERPDNSLKLNANATAGVYLEFGIGFPDVANLRVEIGPEVKVVSRTNDYTKPGPELCELTVERSARLVAEMFVKTYTLDAKLEPFFGPYELSACSTTEPIIGEWKSDENEGTVRIEAAGEGQFRMVALEDLDTDGLGKCIWLREGQSRAITGGWGSYTASFEWVDTAKDCQQVDVDPNGTMTISPYGRNSLRWCGKTPRRSSCESWTRIRPPVTPTP